MATSVITMGPIIILYPFLQKYFVKGMVVGAVKVNSGYLRRRPIYQIQIHFKE